MLNGLDLFSGIGGNSIALRDYVRTIAYCESDRHAQSVLLSRMSDGSITAAPICTDVTELDGSELKGLVDIMVGGFPCQDISVAGNGVGISGKRSGLFREIVRLAKEIEPSFLFLENVPAIRTRGLDTVIEELTGLGYDLRWCMLSAAQVGAPHKRERWFLLGYSNKECSRRKLRGILSQNAKKDRSEVENKNSANILRNAGQDASILANSHPNGSHDAEIGRGSQVASRSDTAGENRRTEFEGRSPSLRSRETTRSDADLSDSERLVLWNEQQRKPGRYSNGIRDEREAESRDDGEKKPMAYSDNTRPQIGRDDRHDSHAEKIAAVTRGDWWALEPNVGRAFDGISERLDDDKRTRNCLVEPWEKDWEKGIERTIQSNKYRVDRIKRLGNAVVPLQAKTAFKYLMGIK